MDSTTGIIQDEQAKQAKKDGERNYHSEKASIAIAKQLLTAVDVSAVMGDRRTWLQIGAALRAISPTLLEDWCSWSSKR